MRVLNFAHSALYIKATTLRELFARGAYRTMWISQLAVFRRFCGPENSNGVLSKKIHKKRKKRLTVKAAFHINRFIESGRAAGGGVLCLQLAGEKFLSVLKVRL